MKRNQKEYMKQYRAKNKEKIRQGQKDYREKNREKVAQMKKKYAEENKEKLSSYYSEYYQEHKDKKKAYDRRYSIKSKYGVELDWYDEQLKRQNGRCAVCGMTEPGTASGYFCVDHNHATGQVRALLCGLCNLGLGHFMDSIPRLERAIGYLLSYDSSNEGIELLRS